jgi:hypothetical protein
MFYDTPRFRLSSFELSFASAHNLGFGGRQGVVVINHPFRFYQHAVLVLRKRDKIPRLKFEGFEDLPWNHHLTAPPHAGGSLLGCGCLHDTDDCLELGPLSV